MPKWWNDKKKAQRNAAKTKPGVHVMSDESIAREREKSGIDYGVGAHQVYDEDSTYMRKMEKKLKGSGASVQLKDERIARGITADEELQGRKLTDLIDRGTLAVGACLILIVIIAVTIPVVLISEEEPYVALAAPDPPTMSPTMVRQTDYWPIYDRLVNIAGGDEVLSDTTTAQNRAFNWLVYEDGMELGASKDHLHQRFVLMVIYFISGPWTPVQGKLEWGSPVHECEWEGITCKDVEDLEKELKGRVDELLESGEDNGVKIDVPQRVINELHLRQRLVSGEVPAEFSLLYYLQHLDLENNQLVGAIPQPLYKLLNLKTLFLEQNELTNVDAIGEYKFLEHVALGKNAFRGPLPTSFSNLKNLKTLYLHTNAWTGQVFDILKEFKSLEFVDIAFNEFEGTLPTELGEMVNLTSVFLGHNLFSGKIPDEIGQCKKLKELQVDGLYNLGGRIPTVLGQLSSLEFLKLDTCDFTGVLPRQLGNLKNLTFLDVSSNSLEGNIPTELGKMTKIKTLGLANNDFSGTVPTEFGMFADLEKLYLQNTDLSGKMPPQVCQLRKGNDTKIEALEVPCDVQCDMDTCCTHCG
jgi:Leucine-rich repeat (LRR) protein